MELQKVSDCSIVRFCTAGCGSHLARIWEFVKAAVICSYSEKLPYPLLDFVKVDQPMMAASVEKFYEAWKVRRGIFAIMGGVHGPLLSLRKYLGIGLKNFSLDKTSQSLSLTRT